MFDSKPILQRLKSYMEEHNINQGDFAKRIGTSGPTFSRWLNGRTRFNPSLKQLLSMAEIFDVTLIDLLSIKKASASRSTTRRAVKTSASAAAAKEEKAKKAVSSKEAVKKGRKAAAKKTKATKAK